MKLTLGAGEWLRSQEENKIPKFLSLNLATIDDKQNKKVVNEIKKNWEDIGVHTHINIVSTGDIQSELIEPRNFEALYYIQVADEESDYYAFWHSSQAEKGGMNLSNYQNEKVDKLLEEIREITKQEERAKKYKKIQELIKQDLPVIPMFSSKYLYVQSKKVKGFDTFSIHSPKDRFSNISNWYIRTGERLVW